MPDPTTTPSSIAVFAGKQLEKLLRQNDKDVKWLVDWLEQQEERTGLKWKRDKNTIYRWQSGVNCLPPEFAELIGGRFNVPAAWFYGTVTPRAATLIVLRGDAELLRVALEDNISVKIEQAD